MTRFGKLSFAITILLLILCCASCGTRITDPETAPVTPAVIQSPASTPSAYPDAEIVLPETSVKGQRSSDIGSSSDLPAQTPAAYAPTSTPATTLSPAAAMTPTPASEITPSPASAPSSVLTTPNDLLTINVETKSGTVSVSGASLPDEASKLIALVSSEREAAGLSALEHDGGLDATAFTRAAEITVSWSHTRPNGSGWSSLSDIINGETLANGYNTSSDVINAWMDSDEHKEIILNPSFTRIGASVLKVNGIVYWVLHFGC